MFPNLPALSRALDSFRIEGRMFCYSNFVPKLYNWCVSMGFEPGKIIPSRAFCSDESQGFPIILITKHFGAFPFNHGRVGGIVSVDRHGPHADHGKDLLLVQASHVGYDPRTGEFGKYRRLLTEGMHASCSCGKIGHFLHRYQADYDYARNNILLTRYQNLPAVHIDYRFTSTVREGLALNWPQLVQGASEDSLPTPLSARSTGAIYPASAALVARLGAITFPQQGSTAIGAHLSAEDFYYVREWPVGDPTQNQLERNLLAAMPTILTARHPMLTAACANTLAEFDRTYHSFGQSQATAGKNLLFIAGLNIDISPEAGVDFPLTKFVPWAAFVQHANGHREILEQDEVVERLSAQSADNPAQLNLDQSIQDMQPQREIEVRL